MWYVCTLVVGLTAFSVGAIANDLEQLARQGFGVVAETTVDGEFEGCDFDKRIPLSNGLMFLCSSYGYTYGYMTEVLILQSVRSGETRVLIGGAEYGGTLYRKP